MQWLPTIVIGAFFLIATVFIVLVYWLMIAVFRTLQLLTLPLRLFARAIRT